MQHTEVFEVPFKMSESHLAHVEKTLGLTPVPAPDARRVNKHAPAAIERLLSERSALKTFALDMQGFEGEPVLLDVYSNAKRIRSSCDYLGLDIGIAHLIPQIVPNDLGRIADARRAGIPYESFKFEELPPPPPGVQLYHGFNFTHSLYYVEPETLVSKMVEHNVHYAYATMHDFPHASARICGGTVAYHYDNDANIKCWAEGDDHIYVHSPCHWLHQYGFNVTIGDDDYCLTWSAAEKIGDTVLYRFVLNPGKTQFADVFRSLDIVDTADPEVEPCGRSLAFVTTLNKELKSPTVDLVYVPVVDAVVFYNMMGFTTNRGKFIPVPRGLIGTLRLAAAGQVRTPGLYQLLLARAKHNIQSLNFPTDMQAEIAIYSTVVAIMVDVEFETATLGTVTRLFKRMFGRHARVLDFEPVYLYTSRQVAAATALASTTIVPMHYYGVDALALTGLKTAAALAFAHPFIAFPLACGAALSGYWQYRTVVSHRSAEAKAWLHWRENLSPGPVGRTIHLPASASFKPAYTVKNANPALKPSAKIRIYGQPELAPPKGLERRGLTLHGIGIQNATPSYVGKDLQSAVEGLRSRVLAEPRYRGTSKDWATIIRKFDDPRSVLNRFMIGRLRNYNDGTFEHWVNRFPSQVQERLREAKVSLGTVPLSDKDFRVQGIVKQEKIGVLTVGGDPPTTDPRIVLSCSPRANAYLGPLHWSVALVRRARFSVKPEKYLCWAASATAEETGLWFDWAIDHYSKPGAPAMIKYGDQARFEKHQGRWTSIVEKRLLLDAGASEEFVEWDRKLKTVRGTMQGMPVSFSLDEPVRISGGNDTSSGNFVQNALAIVHTYGEPGADSYGVMIDGDDFVIVGYADHFGSDEADHDRMALLGFDCEINHTTDPADVEFASQIPYPTADGTVWGPKIGRVLHRFGWTISTAPPDVYGAATSLVTSVNHIPFLRQFIDAHRRLSPESQERYFKYKRLAAECHEATPATYAFIQRRYGLTPQLELAFEERLRSVVSLPALIDWEIIGALIRRDE